MRFPFLVTRSLRYYWRQNLAVVLGAAVGAAVLTGALFVGDSMRASLRNEALRRLGRVAHALVAPRFFTERLVRRLEEDAGVRRASAEAVSAIILPGAATHAETSARAGRITAIGVDEAFWRLGATSSQQHPVLSGRNAILNERLATEVGAVVGDEILLRFAGAEDISPEILLGRRDRPVPTLRVRVAMVIPNDGLGGFALHPSNHAPMNVFVAREAVQKALEKAERVNALLVAHARHPSRPMLDAAILQQVLKRVVDLPDLGLRLRAAPQFRYFALESDRFLLEPPVEEAARHAGGELGLPVRLVLTYLANSISLAGGRNEPPRDPATAGTTRRRSAPRALVPYSTVSAIEFQDTADADMTPEFKDILASLRSLGEGDIALNDWTARALGATIGDRVELTYYVTGPFGRLEEKRHSFHLRAIVPMQGPAADHGLTPDYKGLTDAETIADWDPPFPLDLSRITDEDEHYWRDHRATPKAFLSLADGQRLWTPEAHRFGRLTSVQILAGTPDPERIHTHADRFKERFLDHLSLPAMDMQFKPVREQAAAAGSGGTDFGMLFLGFSFFLIFSGALLVALLFRLRMEQRAKQAGLLLAMGFSHGQVMAAMLAEGLILATVGGLLGLLGAAAYASLMLAGLRSLWSAAVSAPFLELHLSWTSAMTGLLSSFLISLGAITWAVYALKQWRPTYLIAGATQTSASLTAKRGRTPIWVAAVGFVLTLGAYAVGRGAEATWQSLSFFVSGAALLISAMALTTAWLTRRSTAIVQQPGPTAWFSLGIRNAPRRLGRAILTTGLIASATFLVISIQVFRLDVGTNATSKQSGTGGFVLQARSSLALPFDLNTPQGRFELGLTSPPPASFDSVHVESFRASDGDDTSCLNPYAPDRPRILGVPTSMIKRGGFTFAATLAESDEERDNPWLLLHRSFADGAVPAVGDEAAVRWQLHSGLGKDLTITDERGRSVRLRFVALLRQSVLQGELLVAEDAFKRMFPTVSGYGFHLIEAPPKDASTLSLWLEEALAPYGFDVESTTDRLREYLAVQNTYLSAFQTLGGLGLVLGTVGLSVVLLRNVWERRSELALMRALGFSHVAIGAIVLSENVLLVLVGLLSGFVPALVAVAPHLTDGASLPWGRWSALIGAVLVCGLLSGLLSLLPALRAPLLATLRRE